MQINYETYFYEPYSVIKINLGLNRVEAKHTIFHTGLRFCWENKQIII
jgi:hypothetical protein